MMILLNLRTAMKSNPVFSPLSLVLCLVLSSSSIFAADELKQNSSATLLGKPLSATVEADAPAELLRLRTTTTLQILGSVQSALQAIIRMPEIADGPTHTEYYAFGKRIFSENAYFKNEGLLKASAGIAPVEVRVPVVRYPVGPLSLNVDGGVRFQAQIEGQIEPTLWVHPLTQSTIGTHLVGSMASSGFIEGYAKLLVLRGGVGGQIQLVDGQLDLLGTFFFNGIAPRLQLASVFHFLAGKLYAFAETFNLVSWKWKRFWEVSLFAWKGICLSSGSLKCEP